MDKNTINLGQFEYFGSDSIFYSVDVLYFHNPADVITDISKFVTCQYLTRQ